MKRRIKDIAIVVLGGFLNDRLAMHGMARLHASLEEPLFDRRRAFLALEHWRTNGKRLGDKVAQHADSRTSVGVVSHSWGAPTAVALIERLREYAVPVAHWFAIDPVIRWSQIWWSPRNLIALTPWGHFERPDNVARVTLFRQINDWPRGREILGLIPGRDRDFVYGPRPLPGLIEQRDVAGRRTAYYRPDVGHSDIDDLAHIHEYIIQKVCAFKARITPRIV